METVGICSSLSIEPCFFGGDFVLFVALLDLLLNSLVVAPSFLRTVERVDGGVIHLLSGRM